MQVRTTTLPGGEAKRPDHPWLEALRGALDSRLRLRQGVIEYTASPDCLFRINLEASSGNVVLSEGVRVRPGDRLINLHLWTEHVPAYPDEGPTMAWALRISRAFDSSLRELQRYLAVRPDLDDIVAIRGNMPFGGYERSSQLGRLAARFGFERIADQARPSLRQRLHRFGENILIAMTIIARNATALRADALRRDRTLVYLSRQSLQRRYGGARDPHS